MDISDPLLSEGRDSSFTFPLHVETSVNTTFFHGIEALIRSLVIVCHASALASFFLYKPQTLLIATGVAC